MELPDICCLVIEENFTKTKSLNHFNVYLNTDDGHVYKINNLMNSKGILPLFERIRLHNQLFPESKYEFVGFTGFDRGSVYPIFRQEYVSDATFSTPNEIDAYMKSLGFHQTGEAEYSNGDITISDLRPRNVLKDADGDMYVIDADFRKIDSKKKEVIWSLPAFETSPTAGDLGVQDATDSSNPMSGNSPQTTSSGDKGSESSTNNQADSKFISPQRQDGQGSRSKESLPGKLAERSVGRKKKDEINRVIDEAVAFVTGGSIRDARKARLTNEQKRRDLAKEIYDSVLRNDFNEVVLQRINDYIDDATPNGTYIQSDTK